MEKYELNIFIYEEEFKYITIVREGNKWISIIPRNS
jgi:hypothetical protein